MGNGDPHISFDEQDAWFTGSGISCTYAEVLHTLSEINPSEIHVGCDSHLKQTKYIFALAICFKGAKGWRYFIRRVKYPQASFPNLKLRLQNEVVLAVSLANTLRDIKDRDTWIHADLNESPTFKSNQSFKQLTSFIKAMGFNVLVKPFAWASCSVADKHAK